MARQNKLHIYGRVAKPPKIMYNEAGEAIYALLYINTVRGIRDAGDNLHHIKHSFPLITTDEKEFIAISQNLTENDIVSVKGTLNTDKIIKPSFCSECGAKNEDMGDLMYITPIYLRKVTSYETKKEAVDDLIENREISNQAYIHGTLVSNPKKIITKAGKVITQYQLAVNRSFRIRTESPDKTTDYPWVKSYGEQAIEDKLRLMTGSDIYIDGFIQGRKVHRKRKCDCCGTIYEWEDRTMEIVPNSVEYMKGTFRTDEILIAESDNKYSIEELKQRIYDDITSEESTEGLDTTEVDSALVEN